MSVTKDDVQYIAHLARLQVSDKEAEGLKEDMNKILDYMDDLSEVDTSDVEPLEHVTDLEYRLREDEAKEPVDHEDALKNAPDADTDYFRVPRVID
ncbi:Asp-tRNA(Asn)/Glu-tRNA(Gln) amidotransferase subunit GatC [Aliifodinibius sp. S!AR15-10]|uniref:Asp-tRNA(Asn)/Glu-tRNA(Gln) amidotransferase subunit GatC n=1 Tax=Aliifodinibius sp. S!AR15-10 TaxID=2950437 RepID=UPI00285FA814|nr:Asp-tRNA(Asn)/Glu-tRNA(Gln) amidotransferase subunit GatC [Aliifodinibius sp. S!AR15-10]MDR8394062.1 Asp-tRNA(Asn)/Glu-tRNA(Gln) amidotransferase subunit GatC [Aliifodinibius sp. S!AR15-10]